jgi:DNA-binding beta-propeller fold protein YncE
MMASRRSFVAFGLAAMLLSVTSPAVSEAAPVGALTPLAGDAACVGHNGNCRPGRAIFDAQSIAVSGDGRNVYVATQRGSLGVLARDLHSGSLTQLRGRVGCMSPFGRGTCTSLHAGFGGITSVAVSPDDASVYVAWSFTLAVFARDRQTGALTELPSTAGCLDSPVDRDVPELFWEARCASARALGAGDTGALALSSDGRSVYVAGESTRGHGVAVFARDALTSELSQLPGLGGCLSSNGFDGCARGRELGVAEGAAVSPDGRNVYVASIKSPYDPDAPRGHDGVAILARDLRSGALTQLPGKGGCLSSGGIGGCARGRAFDWSYGVVLSPDGLNAYVKSLGAVGIFARRSPSGTLAQLPGKAGCVSDERAGGCARAPGLGGDFSVPAIAPDGRSLYVSSYTRVSAFGRNLRTGALTQLHGRAGCVTSPGGAAECTKTRDLVDPFSPAVSPDGRNVYVPYRHGVAVFRRARMR